MKKKLRLLIVEDEMMTALCMQAELSQENVEVCGIVSRAQAAIDAVGIMRPDLILMDIRLKGDKDGITAAEEIRKISKLPIVFISGYGNRHIEERIQEIENTAFLVKPVKVDDIRNVIGTCCMRGQAD